MGEGFEWVTHNSSEDEEQENKSLPVAVKKTETQLTLKSFFRIIFRGIAFAGIVVLALIARLLLILLRVRIPPISLPPKVKQVSGHFFSQILSIRINKPDWLILPKIRLKVNLPYEKLRPIFSGLSFIFILTGLGAVFSLFERGFTAENQISIVLGLTGLIWLVWDKHARAVIAQFLLKIVHLRNNRK